MPFFRVSRTYRSMARITSDFSDVDDYFRKGIEEVRRTVDKVGQDADNYDVQHGDYVDRTGTLRKSNRHEVGNDGSLTLINDAESENGFPYASNVESKDYQVRSGGALYAEKRLKEIFEK